MYNNNTKPDDVDGLENVDYNNDASITDLVPIKKLQTIKEENDDEEGGLQITKTVNYGNITDDNDGAKFILKVPLHPRERIKCLSKNYSIWNQADKKKISQILPQKKLLQKNRNQSKDIEYIKKRFPCEHLKHKKRKLEPEIHYVKTVPQHPLDQLSRRRKDKPANIICDEEFLKEF